MSQDLFKYLNRNNDKVNPVIEEKIKKYWYEARAYVRKMLPIWEGEGGINKDSKKHLHFVVKDINERTLAVARQIALMAHYTNFNDYDKETSDETATHITFIYNQGEQDKVTKMIEDEAFLGNLLHYCKEKYVDVKIHLQEEEPNDSSKITINNDEIAKDTETKYEIDTFMAEYVNMAYNIGTEIDNLPADDPNTAKRYDLALDVFCEQKSDEERQKLWDENIEDVVKPKEANQYAVRNVLSNVFCADCFESRMRGIVGLMKKEDRPDLNGKSITDYIKDLLKKKDKKERKYLINQFQSKVKETIAKNLENISRCEHSRWVVEKLILGFKPLTLEDHYNDAELFGRARENQRNKLKKENYRHIDICSYKDLRRLSPNHMKYDCFLMLAIPYIMRSYCDHLIKK